jgi:ribose transport system substrate-binding protein
MFKDSRFFLFPVAIIVIYLLALPAVYAKKTDTTSITSTRFSIGVLYWSMNIEGQVAMRTGLEAAAKTINASAQNINKPSVKLLPFIAGEGIEGIERQINQMTRLVDDGVDLIIVQPTDIAALSVPLQYANKAGIPVIAYDQHIIGGELKSFITSDNYQAGYLNGEYVAAQFPADKILRIILIEYPHVSSTVRRIDGFIDALEHYQQAFKIINTYSAVDPISGMKAAIDILRDFPDKNSIDVIFSINDGAGLTIASTLEDVDRNEIFFVSIDGDPASVEKIKQGSVIKIDSAQFCGEIGAETMRTAYKLLLGQPINKEILIPVFPITTETIDRYNGWTGAIPEPFRKPWFSDQPNWSGDNTSALGMEQ